MTPEQVQKDREAGTEGKSWVVYPNCECEVYSELNLDEAALRLGAECTYEVDIPICTPSMAGHGLDERAANARRIARVPDLEAFYLDNHDAAYRIEALGAQVEALRALLKDLRSECRVVLAKADLDEILEPYRAALKKSEADK